MLLSNCEACCKLWTHEHHRNTRHKTYLLNRILNHCCFVLQNIIINKWKYIYSSFLSCTCCESHFWSVSPVCPRILCASARLWVYCRINLVYNLRSPAVCSEAKSCKRHRVFISHRQDLQVSWPITWCESSWLQFIWLCWCLIFISWALAMSNQFMLLQWKKSKRRNELWTPDGLIKTLASFIRHLCSSVLSNSGDSSCRPYLNLTQKSWFSTFLRLWRFPSACVKAWPLAETC